MKIYNLIVRGENWYSSELYESLDAAIKKVKSMEEGQKILEGLTNVGIHVVNKDYECPPWLNMTLHNSEWKYASESRTLVNGEITTMWRVVYEQEVK